MTPDKTIKGGFMTTPKEPKIVEEILFEHQNDSFKYFNQFTTKEIDRETCIEMMVKSRQEALQAINSLRRADMEAVIGDNRFSEHKEWDCPCGATHSFTEEWHATNKLRDEQRKIMEERLK